MKDKLQAFKKNLVLGLLALSGVSAPNFVLAFDASELMTPEEVEYQSSVLDYGFSNIAEANAYMRDPRGDRAERAADRLDRRNRDIDRADRDRRPRPPDRRPGPPDRRPEPPRRDRFVYQCYARNGRGFTFMAEDRFDARYAQREAMRSCYRQSRNCYELGCRQVRR